MDIRNITQLAPVATICVLLAACGGGSGGSSSGANGELSLSITDAPIYNANKVEVDFIGVEVKPAEGEALRFNICKNPQDASLPIVQQDECSDSDPVSEPDIQTIDLLKQTNGASFLLLDRVAIPVGRVNWLRLVLADPAGRIELPGGGIEPLTVPSGNQTGLKLNRGFDVIEGSETRLFIDFDVRKSIVVANGKYKLKPSLRLVEDFGSIAGTVDPLLLSPTCEGPSVYVFEGAGTTPDDIDRDKGDPVTSTMVNDDGSYRADFLEPGEYTAAFICAEGGPVAEPEDDPDLDDAVSFTPPAGKPATVADGETFALDF